MPVVRQLFCLAGLLRAFVPIRVTNIVLHHADWKYFVKPEFAHLYLASFSKTLKHFEKEIIMGIYEWE